MATVPQSFEGQVIPGLVYVLVTPSDNDLPDGPCRALLIGTAGTLNLTQTDGVERDSVPAQVGILPLQALKVRAGGTADNIWAIY